MKQNEFVKQISSDNHIYGCGFFVGPYFLTAGHVIEDMENPSIEVDGKRIYLKDQLGCRNDKTADGYDIAVFRIPGVVSPVELCGEDPCKGMVLESVSYEVFEEGNRYIECEAVVNEIREVNYFCADTTASLKKGSSGSPVFYNGKVAGMMHAGNNDGGKVKNPLLSLNFCMFLSASAIKEFISQINQS